MASFQIKAIRGDFEKFATRVVQKVVLSVNGELIKTTPVDTGWARSNWIPNIGHPYAKPAGSRIEAEMGTLDLSPQQKGTANIATKYHLNDGTIYITNNVYYIKNLNDGSSKQAPKAFVQMAIENGIRKVKGIKQA
jgi:hypothetical protein